MERVIFHIGTEFHVFIAEFIIEQFHERSIVKYYYLVNRVNGKLSARLSEMLDKADNVRYVDYKSDGTTLQQGFALELEKLSNLDPTHFISFLNTDAFSIQINEHFNKRENIQTALAPDGMNAYASYKYFFSRTNLHISKKYWRYILRNGLSLSRLRWIRVSHAANSDYDVLYNFGEPVNSMDSTSEQLTVKLQSNHLESIEERNNPLKYDYKLLEYLPKDNIILIIGQNYNGALELDKDIVSYITSKRREYIIAYKVHPNVHNSRSNRFSDELEFIMEKAILIDRTFPVELYIHLLNDSIVLSSYSTSAIFYNPSCRYAWYYPLREKVTTQKGRISFRNPCSHIKVLSDLGELYNFIDN